MCATPIRGSQLRELIMKLLEASIGINLFGTVNQR